MRAVRREGRQEPLDVAVLAAGTVSDDAKAAAWIFSRWPQENSIGCLLRHVRIGELTARAWNGYEDSDHTVQDRQVESQSHKDLIGRWEHIAETLGRKLLRQRQARRAGAPDPEPSPAGAGPAQSQARRADRPLQGQRGPRRLGRPGTGQSSRAGG